MREIALTTAFALVPALLGALSTYLFEDEVPLLWRAAAGSCTGFAALGLSAFVLAFALPVATTLAVVWLMAVVVSALLLAVGAIRRQILADLSDSARQLRRAAHQRPQVVAVYGLISVVFVVMACMVLDRVLLVSDDGLHTGIMNNFGDLPFHLGVIARFAGGQNVPPENPIFAGVPFTYPFMADFLTAMPVAAGAGVRSAMLAQNGVLLVAFAALLYWWALELTRDPLAATMSCALVIMSGGLGWWMLLGDAQHGSGVLAMLQHLPHDYTVVTRTPWRWGNVVTALLIPQRSLLLGLPLALVILTLVYREVDRGDPGAPGLPRRMIAAGLLTGLLPLVHAHSFMVVVGMTACLSIWFGGARRWFGFFGASMILALPQLAWSAYRTATNASTFIGWHLGWDHGSENPIWFWFRNTGIFIPLVVSAFVWSACRKRLSGTAMKFYLPFTLCFVVPNAVRLAPWIWDNIKVLIYWFIASAPFAALALAELWRRRGASRLVAGMALASLTLAGALDIWRVVSGAGDALMFDSQGIQFAERLRDETPARALILHAPVHNHPVFLSGRRSFMGYPGHVWSHGLNDAVRAAEIKEIYAGSVHAPDLLARDAIDYVVVGPLERSMLHANGNFFRQFSKVDHSGEFDLYRVSSDTR